MRYLLLFFFSFPAFADAIYRFDNGEMSITLYNEKCESQIVKNLPIRAVMVEDGVVYEGCAGEVSWGPVILLFMDKKGTVGAIPNSLFKPAKSI